MHSADSKPLCPYFTERDPEPSFYSGQFTVDKVKDTYISLRGWSKGVAFINGFNIGRFWPVL